MGQLGMVSDYAGPNAFLAFEVLNLLARPTIVGTRRVHEAATLEGLDAGLYVDAAPPDRDVARRLYAFAEAGGALITPPGWEERGAPSDGPWRAAGVGQFQRATRVTRQMRSLSPCEPH